MTPTDRSGRRLRQQGAATLIVVMVLFFIISLVAAYTNRSLIFEQRTSLNQYRSSQALEVADAGLEWAISQLNFERLESVTNQCFKNANLAGTPPSFRERYLNINTTTGKITPRANPAGGGVELTPSCVWTGGTGWSCSCPTTGAPVLTAPTAAGVWPAFRVRFRTVLGTGTPTVPQQPSAVWVDVVGCTRLDPTGSADPCLTFDGQGTLNEGRAVVSSIVTLAGNAAGLPQAALTVFGTVTATAALSVYNTQPSGSGITVHASGPVASAAASSLVLRSSPGTPATTSWIEDDAKLNPPAAPPPTASAPLSTAFTARERMFAMIFRMRPETFRTQQAAVEIPCPAGCTAAVVRAALAANPGRPLWLTGTLSVDTAGPIGSAAEPALLVINGHLEFTGAGTGVNIYGLVYTRLPVPNPAGLIGWATNGAGQINGAMVSEGDVSGTGTATIVYEPEVLNRLRYTVGSFVRVPGSWRDFR